VDDKNGMGIGHVERKDRSDGTSACQELQVERRKVREELKDVECVCEG